MSSEYVETLRKFMAVAKRALHNVETYAPPQTTQNARAALEGEIAAYEAAIAALQQIESQELVRVPREAWLPIDALGTMVLEMHERANEQYDEAVKAGRHDESNEAATVIGVLNRIGRHIGVLIGDDCLAAAPQADKE